MKARRFRRLKERIARWRTIVAKRIDPGAPEDPSWDIPINFGLRGAAELRGRLNIDEETYLTVAGQALGNARDYIVYTALDEVEKTAMYLMRLRELLQGEPIKPR